MNVFLLYNFDKKFLHDLAIDERLFMDENGNYWCAIGHSDEDEFEFVGHLLKKVSGDHMPDQNGTYHLNESDSICDTLSRKMCI